MHDSCSTVANAESEPALEPQPALNLQSIPRVGGPGHDTLSRSLSGSKGISELGTDFGAFLVKSICRS